jgi:hypothetical protein
LSPNCPTRPDEDKKSNYYYFCYEKGKKWCIVTKNNKKALEICEMIGNFDRYFGQDPYYLLK